MKYQQYEKLKNELSRYEKVAVAFSGGIDSAFLLWVAKEVLGTNVIGLMADTEALPSQDRSRGEIFCEELQIPLYHVTIHQMELPSFQKNEKNRCYECKYHLFTILKQKAAELGDYCLLEGSNIDDNNSYRPGRKALQELQIASPLETVGFTKDMIRSMAKEKGISFWNQPSAACLASRVSFGQEISKELLRGIDCCETYMRTLGASQVRVRCHGNLARIELLEEEMFLLAPREVREEVYGFFKEQGFVYVTIDVMGFCSGSMDLSV